jgi:outer membrane protein OmpA-like peptidoglycan-associated protein
MKKIPVLLAVMALWFVGSAYWYTCNVKYACNSAPSVTQTTVASPSDKSAPNFDGEKFDKLVTFYFRPDLDQMITDSSTQSQLQEIANYAKANPAVSITIKGYTAYFPNHIDDIVLSKDRADEIRQRIQALGVIGNTITIVPKGTDEQIGSGSSEQELAKNRRATVLFNEEG